MLHYLIIGAGGTGGCLAAYLKEAGKEVSVIARGAHLAAIQSQGLTMHTTAKGDYVVKDLPAFSAETYQGRPDVIFVCVKGYSLSEITPFIRRVAQKETVVIPILNIYGTGEKLQKELPGLLVTDGCIYVASEIEAPGVIRMNGDIFRVVYGVRHPEEFRPVLREVAKDLEDAGIRAILSENIRRDALQKFAFVSPMGACGIHFQSTASAAQVPGEARDFFLALTGEIIALADAMGLSFPVDVQQTNLKILDALKPDASSSLQRDLWAHHPSELDGLIFEVVRMGHRLKVPVPCYELVAREMGYSEETK